MIDIDNNDNWKYLDPSNFYHKLIHLPQNVLMAYDGISLVNLNYQKYDKIKFQGNDFLFSVEIVKKIIPSKYIDNCDKDDNVLIINIDKEEAVISKNVINIIRKGNLQNKPGIEISVKSFENICISEQCVILLKIIGFYGILKDCDKYVYLAVANLVQKAGAICKAKKLPYNLSKYYAKSFYNKKILLTTDNNYYIIVEYCKWLSNKFKLDNIVFDDSQNINYDEMEFILFLRKFFDKKKLFVENKKIKVLDIYSDGKNELSEFLSLIYFLNLTFFYSAILKEISFDKI